MRSRRHLLIFLAVVLLAGIGFQSALAVTPNDVQYNTTTTNETTAFTPPAQTTESSGVKESKTPTATSGGTLPFTGLDLGVAFGAGALLVAGGFGLRRLGRKSGRSES